MTCLSIATQAEAEAGVVNDKCMTPLRTNQAIAALGVAANLRDFGADPTGATSSTAAFLAALAVADKIVGVQGDTYLIGSEVSVPSGKEIVGNGASLKIGSGVIGLRLSNGNCKVSGWKILGNGGLYAVLSESDNNGFIDNVCSGNIGHFFFATNSKHVVASGNRIEGRSATGEITTAIACEMSKHILVTNNQFNDIPVGWGVQIRNGSENFTVSNNSFLQTQFGQEITAIEGQTVFDFTLGSVCLLKKIQIAGIPLSSAGNYTITGSGPTYTVTFLSGRTAGERVKLVGYRGAENIQINSGSKHGSITGNNINGTGDSGIILHGSHLTCAANSVYHAGYAGIAVYGDQDHVSITGNTIVDCSQMDDGLSSPDNPMLHSVFAGAILLSGIGATVSGNTIVNTPANGVPGTRGTMRYGVLINKTDMDLRTDGTPVMALAANTFDGIFVDGTVLAPNEQTGQRINSISVDGPEILYPQQIDVDQAWTLAPYAPGATPYFALDGFNSWALRDTAIKQGGNASIRTQPNSYVDFDLLAAGMFKNCNVTITFWAKNDNGSSYVSVFTDLAGLLLPLTAEITDTAWQQYTISFPLTDNLESKILLRVGGNSGFANIQHIQISGKRL